MLKYPNKDPAANHMLTKYTIWKDIDVSTTFLSLLESNPELLKDIKNGNEQIPESQVHNQKMSVYVSIALEAERALKHVFVDM